ncbi:putative 6-phosphofructo-2-kinase, Fructose-2,6-bisphosphate 2-phosphatase [Helianthus annuus]|uniref:6-phosphofructo-2-kinase, Fructose-2,6-bisphosphate 2-phosphatase n=1 Tax=Helianthus annuus TaxID=4232 RepID=A0A251TPC4_HELAN|nr:putative 6-phosphofructo-2-kinase, Fructose-2,6-bisphosphate 2-phosphatase [Helianthus annuus]KAJ0885495.1 putative 6-phosphofructo-2-kinase, Fructose-2,6-bisphosphate 2-phosphatase [Helianthus annuus]
MDLCIACCSKRFMCQISDRSLKEIPQIEMPLHMIIEIQMGVTGVQEKWYKLVD